MGDTPVRNKGQAAACPDRTRAIPCTLQRRQQVNPPLETQRFLRDLSHHNRDTLTGTGRQRFIPSLGRYLGDPLAAWTPGMSAMIAAAAATTPATKPITSQANASTL